MRRLLLSLTLLLALAVLPTVHATSCPANEGAIELARIQYGGGGDWYASPTALPNLAEFACREWSVPLALEQVVIELDRDPLDRYPMLFLTGHGTVHLTPSELDALRTYLQRGGFLWVDDDYGLDPSVRPLLNALFEGQELQTVRPDHPIYRTPYRFDEGRPPKVHEHDGGDPEGLGLFLDGRLAVLYTFESNPSDGWAHDEHENPEEIVQSALQFGANVLIYLFTSIE